MESIIDALLCINASITYMIMISIYRRMLMSHRRHDLHLPRVKRNWGKQRFAYHALQDWNSLGQDIKAKKHLYFFSKTNLKN